MKLKKKSIKNLSGSNRLIKDNEKTNVNGGLTWTITLPPVMSAFLCNIK